MKASISRLLLTIAFTVFLLHISPGFAENSTVPPSLYLNDAKIQLTAPSIIQDGTTYIPVKDLFLLFDFNVEWNEKQKKVIATHGDYRITLEPHSTRLVVNGVAQETSASILIVNARTYVPVRFLSTILGADVSWDSHSNSVNIYTGSFENKIHFKDHRVQNALLERVGKQSGDDLLKKDIYYMVNLDLSDKGIVWLDDFFYLSNVKKLNLSNNNIDELKPLNDLKEQLVELNLSHNKISTIRELADFNTLEVLDVSNNPLASIESVEYMLKLKELKLANTSLYGDEAKAPLLNIKDRVSIDISLDDVKPSKTNTAILKSKAAFKLEVANDVYWVPANSLGISHLDNSTISYVLDNTPEGKESTIDNLYDLCQFWQNAKYTDTTKKNSVLDSSTSRHWNYVSAPSVSLKTFEGDSRAIASASAYLLSNNFSETGTLNIYFKDGTSTALTYVKYLHAYYEEVDDDDEDDIYHQEYEYYILNPRNYCKNSLATPAIENGFKEIYDASGGIQNNIHMTHDLMNFVNALSSKKQIIAAYTVQYKGSVNATNCYGTYGSDKNSNTGTLIFLPKHVDKDEVDPYTIIFEDTSDTFYFKRVNNPTSAPRW